MIDLHIHTSASSDGQHSVDEIFSIAKSLGIKAIAITDHNSAASIPKGVKIKEKYNIEFIPAIELNTEINGEDLHLLGYFIPYKNEEFIDWLKGLNGVKIKQSLKRANLLKKIGFNISEQEVSERCKEKPMSGPAFFYFLQEKQENLKLLEPYITGNKKGKAAINFYLDFFDSGKPAYLPPPFIKTNEAVCKLLQFKSVPVVAHPVTVSDNSLFKAIKSGILGLEAFSTYHKDDEILKYKKLAEEKNLLITYGSDFHGDKVKPHIKMKLYNSSSLDALKKLKEKAEEIK